MTGGIALIGYRGTGKSTVGRLLAEALGLPFVDADAEVESRARRTIAEIFREDGEPAFRDLEEAVIADLVARGPAVIATGGGCILRETNRERLRGYGPRIWLTAPPDLIVERLARNPGARPSLTSAGLLAEVEQVLSQREPLYVGLATTAVDTSGRTPSEVVELIRRVLGITASAGDGELAR